MSDSPENDLDFLPPRAAAFYRVGHKKTYLAQKVIFLFFAVFIIWSYFFQLHEVTKGTGKIISSTHNQTISNLEGGIIKEILVRDNQIVTQGQVLIRLDTTISKAKYYQGLENYYRFLASAERLSAQIRNQQTFVPSQDLMTNAPNLAIEEGERFSSNYTKKQNDINIARKDFEIKQQELNETKAKLMELEEQFEYVSEQVKIITPLAKKKIYSQMDYLKLMRDYTDQKSQMRLLKINLKRLKVGVKQAKDRLDQVTIRYRTDDFQELRDIEGKLAEIRSVKTADQDRVLRSEIRSPITGTIRDIKVRTLGGIIQPGEALLDIVPLNDTLVIEAQIAPSDVAFIRPGMVATVKVTAYDFSSYGGLEATVEYISADTITDKREQTFYRVLLQTKSNVLQKKGKLYSIMPGMQVEVDILTGHKSVLNYFMKPFLRAVENSLTER